MNIATVTRAWYMYNNTIKIKVANPSINTKETNVTGERSRRNCLQYKPLQIQLQMKIKIQLQIQIQMKLVAGVLKWGLRKRYPVTPELWLDCLSRQFPNYHLFRCIFVSLNPCVFVSVYIWISLSLYLCIFVSFYLRNKH